MSKGDFTRRIASQAESANRAWGYQWTYCMSTPEQKQADAHFESIHPAQHVEIRFAYSFNTQGNRDPNQFGAWFQVLFAFLVPICVGIWVFAGPILETLFGTGFGSAVWVLRILLIYLVIESADAVMVAILRAADIRRFAVNPLTNILVNLLLLPTLGTIGAAIGRVSGVGASATLRHLLITRKLTGVN